MDAFGAWLGELEVRQEGGASVIVGRFPLWRNGVIADRGTVRKESFSSRAFRFSIEDTTRRIDLLVGHDFGKPIASRQSGTLTIEDGDDAVRFVANLPVNPPSWVVDVERLSGREPCRTLSPGFRVPPKGVVPNAETFRPEVGNPSVQIRQINDAVLREFSVVTSGTYEGAGVELGRKITPTPSLWIPRSTLQWL